MEMGFDAKIQPLIDGDLVMSSQDLLNVGLNNGLSPIWHWAFPKYTLTSLLIGFPGNVFQTVSCEKASILSPFQCVESLTLFSLICIHHAIRDLVIG